MSKAADANKNQQIGQTSSSFWLGLLVLSVIVFGANTGVATWQSNRLASGRTGAANLQVLSQQLANYGRQAVAGDANAFVTFKDTKDQIEQTVGDLDAQFGNDNSASGPLNVLKSTWGPLSKSANEIVNN